MRERVYRTEALILRRQDFGEADRLLLLASPAGKRRVVAKGTRKTSSRLAGHIELFTYANMLLAIGRNLDIVTQSQVLQSFPVLRNDLSRLSLAYYAAELYDKFIQEEEENRALFRLLVQTFTALDMTINPDLLLRAYELRLLHNAGYRPHLHRCVVCQELLTEQADHFSPALGGVLCTRDVAADRTALPMSLNAFKLLRYLQSQPLAAVERMHLSAAVRIEVEQMLRTYLRRLLERDLKSVAFLDYVRHETEP
jgi:DNA repair protein RecO (recombination protein O)